MRSKGVAMENSLEKMFNIPLLNTFQKLVIIGSSGVTSVHSDDIIMDIYECKH